MLSIKSYVVVNLALLLFFNAIDDLHAKTQPAETIPLSELRAFSEAYYQIKSNYARPTDDAELLRAAIQGMVASLDKYSKYMPKEEFEQFNAENEGEYAGIGLSFNDHQYGLEITAVVNNGPASRAGILPQMLVTQINKKDVQFMSREDAYELLKGPPGESINLTISASNFAKPRDFNLVREVIFLESVLSERLPNDIGYIAISQFTLKSLDEFKAAINTMSTEQALKQLIIDLRNNPGGVMQVALDLSDLFINQGKLLVSNGRTKDSNRIFFANHEAILDYLDVVIVMNSGSASASEIFAGALHDHKKAILLGEKSYGKGSIQTVIPLNLSSGMKLTSAEYFSPLGNKIQDVGIEPDVKFEENEIKNPYSVSLLDDPQLLQAYNLLFKQAH